MPPFARSRDDAVSAMLGIHQDRLDYYQANINNISTKLSEIQTNVDSRITELENNTTTNGNTDDNTEDPTPVTTEYYRNGQTFGSYICKNGHFVYANGAANHNSDFLVNPTKEHTIPDDGYISLGYNFLTDPGTSAHYSFAIEVEDLAGVTTAHLVQLIDNTGIYDTNIQVVKNAKVRIRFAFHSDTTDTFPFNSTLTVYLRENAVETVGGISRVLQTVPDPQPISAASYMYYDPVVERIVTTVALETTLNSLYLGKNHKMSSGAANIYFTDLTTQVNYYPAWGHRFRWKPCEWNIYSL